MEARVGQVRIGEDQLFAGERPDACRFDADRFDGTTFIINHDKVAHFKRTVEKKNEIIEQVGQYGLRGQRNSNTPYTQTGQYCGNVVAAVVDKKKDQPINGEDKSDQ